MQGPTIVMGVIGSDCHAVGNKILYAVFTRAGFHVVNLGVMVSPDEFIDTAIEVRAQAIVVASVYGFGELDCTGMRDRCIERGLDDIPLYVGGNLVIDKRDFREVEAIYKGLGFSRVFPPDVDLERVCQLLRQDTATWARYHMVESIASVSVPAPSACSGSKPRRLEQDSACTDSQQLLCV
jgi:methylaspartate mutase sigma subunit